MSESLAAIFASVTLVTFAAFVVYAQSRSEVLKVAPPDSAETKY
jgi:hypothetical protein